LNGLLHLFERGGWVMPAIVTLSVILYSRCFRLLFSLWRLRRQARAAGASRPALHRLQHEARESFRRQRVAIGPMIAAAPLLGLLGTVSGMEKTFASLSAAAGEKSMEGLAGGISEVLVATESGLTVAIPAMVLVYLAHREVTRQVQVANRIERGLRRAGGAT
jgi:biopolymer transport protein ExbB